MKLMYQMQEIPALKQFDFIIVHNEKMKSFLKTKGIDESKMISLGIFDYLIPSFDEIRQYQLRIIKIVLLLQEIFQERNQNIYTIYQQM